MPAYTTVLGAFTSVSLFGATLQTESCVLCGKKTTEFFWIYHRGHRGTQRIFAEDRVMDKLLKIFATFVVASAFCFSTNLFAQSMHGEPELEDAVPYSLPYEGQALWFEKWFEDLGPYRSSAVRINSCWGIANGHSFLINGTYSHSHEVGNGTNVISDRGVVREIAEYHIHPTWEAGGGVWNGHRIDLVVFRFAQPLPGDDLEIGSLSLGETFEYAGFGRPAIPGVGLLPVDGQRRAWDAGAHDWGNGGTVSDKYVRSRFMQPGHYLHLPMGGVGTGGGSGSGGFNLDGDIVALLASVYNSPNYSGGSYGLRLDLPEIKDWIESFTDDMSCLPPRPSINILSKSVAAHLATRCRVGKEPC